jgi:hypothetical protein
MTDITSASFGADVFTSDVVRNIIHEGLAGAPVFSALTQRSTSRGSVVFPTADPSGFDWTPELGEIPSVDPGDDSAVIVPTKLAGLLLLSSESVGDTELNLTTEIGRLIQQGMAAKADTDLIYGPDTPAPEAPAGVFDGLTLVDEDTLRASVVAACADIMANGGTPTTVLLSPSLWAEEMQRREDTPVAVGPLLADLGLPGLEVKVANTLKAGDGLVVDKAGAFAILRNDYSIEASTEAATAWTHDGVSLRVKARLAVAIPSPGKHARALGLDSA